MEPIIYYVLMEDDENARELVQTYFKEFPNFECKGCFGTALETRDFLLHNEVHLLVADIQLPDMNGMEMVESLPHRPLTVFMTGHNSKKKATKGYALDAVHYLTKPLIFKEFKEAMVRVMDRLSGKPNIGQTLGNEIIFGHGLNMQRVILVDIIYIESMSNYVLIHLSNDIRICVRETLKEVMRKLPEQYFIQAHRSCIICTWHIRALQGSNLTLYHTAQRIQVSRSCLKKIRQYLDQKVNK